MVSNQAIRADDTGSTLPKTTMAVLKLLHGHLGPYVSLGGRMGDYAVEKLGLKRHGLKEQSDVRVIVECEPNPPKSCLVDGLQASTGATYGKRNIFLIDSKTVRVRVINTETKKGLEFKLSERLQENIKKWFAEKVSLEKQSETIMSSNPQDLFIIKEFSDD